MTDSENNSTGCFWVIVLIIILVCMCERLENLERKINPEPNIEIPKDNGK